MTICLGGTRAFVTRAVYALSLLAGLCLVGATAAPASAKSKCKPPKKFYKGKCRYQDDIKRMKKPKTRKAGTRGGKCYGNGTCNFGLVCRKAKCRRAGDGKLHGKCYGNNTCDKGLICHENSCIKANLSEGETCLASASCNTGLECRAGKCQARTIGLGQSCGPSQGRCSKGLVCRAGVCQVPIVNAGGRCGPAYGNCNTGLYCRRGICRRRGVGLGRKCGQSTGKCGAGLQCSKGRCQRITSKRHGACGPVAGQCTGSLACLPWKGQTICRHPKSGRLGYACLPDNSCTSGLTCRNSRCQTLVRRAGPLTYRSFKPWKMSLKVPNNWKPMPVWAGDGIRKFKGHKGRVYLFQINRLTQRLDLKTHLNTMLQNVQKRRWRVRYKEQFLFKELEVLYVSVDQGITRSVSYVINGPANAYVLTFVVDSRFADERLFGRIFKSIQLH